MLSNGTAGQVLQSNGTTLAPSWMTLSGGGDALVANPLSQFAATTSAQLAGVISDEQGSGGLVFATSPTLTTPTLGAAIATSISSIATSTLTLDSGTTGILNLGTGNNAKTINIGTGTAGNTINIGTNDTTLDLIGIGSTLDTLTLIGNSSSTFVLNGLTLSTTELGRLDGKDAALVDTNDAVAIAITGTGALDAGSITSGFGTIDTGADNITTTGTVFGNNFDRSTAGALTFGNTNATSASICNSANCDTITLGNNADADTITIGDVSDSTALNSANWSITTAGLVTTASDIAINGGDITSTATTLNIDVANTGSILFRDGANTLFTVADAGTVGTLTATGSIVTSNLGVDYTDSDTNPTCAVGEYKIYADTSETKLKKCANGVVSDLNAIPDVNSFTDTTSEAVADGDTTNYWDGTVPNITPKSTGSEILVMMSANITATSNTDTQISAQIMRHTSAITCQTTGTAVGGQVGTFQGLNVGSVEITKVFVDNPGTTSNVQYTLCSEADSEGAVGTMTRIDFTLFEINDAADLAEMYSTNDETLGMGDVVSLDPSLQAGVQKSEGVNDRRVIGIVSSKPAMVIGGKNDEGVSAVPVALSGRVPVKVVTENGAIEIGDYLSASSVPGVAMKANGAGPVIGQAMSAYEGEGVGLVTVFIKNFEISVDPLLLGDVSTNEGLATLIADIQAEVAHNPISVLNDKISAGNKILTDLIVARVTAIRGYFDEIFARKVHTEEICVKKSDDSEVCVNGDQIDALLQNNNIAPTSPTSTSSSVETPVDTSSTPTSDLPPVITDESTPTETTETLVIPTEETSSTIEQIPDSTTTTSTETSVIPTEETSPAVEQTSSDTTSTETQ